MGGGGGGRGGVRRCSRALNSYGSEVTSYSMVVKGYRNAVT